MARTTRPKKVAALQSSAIKKADFVSALARGLDVLRLFSEDRPRLTSTEVATLTGVSRAAGRRFLLTLMELGYLGADGDTFEPRPKLLELGYTYLSTWRFPQLVQPYLQDVVDTLQENCSFAMLDESDVVYLARAEARRIVQSITVSLGTRIPASLSSLGRAILAYQTPEAIAAFLALHPLRAATKLTVTNPAVFRTRLAEIREQGWALVNGEFEEDLLSMAVPVVLADGRVLGAINVGAPSSRADVALMQAHHLPILQRAAAGIARVVECRGDAAILPMVRHVAEAPTGRPRP